MHCVPHYDKLKEHKGPNENKGSDTIYTGLRTYLIFSEEDRVLCLHILQPSTSLNYQGTSVT